MHIVFEAVNKSVLIKYIVHGRVDELVSVFFPFVNCNNVLMVGVHALFLNATTRVPA